MALLHAMYSMLESRDYYCRTDGWMSINSIHTHIALQEFSRYHCASRSEPRSIQQVNDVLKQDFAGHPTTIYNAFWNSCCLGLPPPSFRHVLAYRSGRQNLATEGG